MTYLGYIIRPGELLIGPVTVRCLKDALLPSTKSELRSFMGLCNFYRRFVRRFSDVAAPLNVLLRKDAPEKFGELSPDASAAFRKLRDAVSSPLVPALPTPGLSDTVDCDASDYQVAVRYFKRTKTVNAVY